MSIEVHFVLSLGRRRYRCDTDHRDYCSSLLERYEVPPAQEAVDDNDDEERPEEQVQIRIINIVYKPVLPINTW